MHSALAAIAERFPSQPSPYGPDAEREVRGFARRHGLLSTPAAMRHYDRSNFGDLAARVYPHSSRTTLTLLAEWLLTWAIFDDQLEQLPLENPAAFENASAALLSTLSTDSVVATQAVAHLQPFGTAFPEVWHQIAAARSIDWRRRYVSTVADYLDGCRWEAAMRQAARPPDVATFIERRRAYGGIKEAMALVEVSRDFELPVTLHEDPYVVRLMDALGDIALWGNDVFSFEVDVQERTPNLIVVLHAERGGTMDACRNEVIDMVSARVADFERFRSGLDQWRTRCGISGEKALDLRKFLQGMHDWISGSFAWSTDNERYAQARFGADSIQPNALASLGLKRRDAGAQVAAEQS